MLQQVKFYIEYNIILQVKFFFQRLFRGYSDDEVWDLDNAILRFTLPRLKALRKITQSYPCTFEEGNTEEGWDRWKVMLDKMIHAIELKLKDEYWYVESATVDKDTAKVEEGMSLFHEYFDALWD
jgi:hypothetical protein